MTTDFAELAEIVRFPSPAPAPQALACDGEHLWLGSWETARFYGIYANQGRVFEEEQAPGKPVGATVVGDELRVVCSELDDSRVIRRYVPGHGFKSHDTIACPDDTGSFLAFDGTTLWLSQRYNKVVLVLDAQGVPIHTIPIGEEIVGMVWAGERLYLSLWLGKERGGCRIAYIEPTKTQDPQPIYVAQSPFVAVSLARDGDRFWTNDVRACELVAFSIPD
jgi:hypothetical protein